MVVVDILKIQQELDRSFQECYGLCEEMPKLLKKHLSDDPIHEIGEEGARQWLQPVANKVYRKMVNAMFGVLPYLQPQDFPEGGRPVNFYFWPGYRPALAGRRLYYKIESAATGLQSAGVGVWGDPTAEGKEREWTTYDDCSHSHWYHYATNRPKDMEFYPGSVYWWFNSQLPTASANSADLVNSLTVTTSEDGDPSDPRFVVLRLAGDSYEWGEQLRETINTKVGPNFRRFPDLEFPDRPGKPKDTEEPWRTVRCRLLALFMHAAFREKAPDWLPELEREILKKDLVGVIDLKRAEADPIAMDWSDKSSLRKPFQCWSTITLQPMLNAFPSGYNATAVNSRLFELENESIGSASLFCSVFLRKEFIAVIRDYVRKVYAMMRNFEVAIANQNLLIQTRLSGVSQSAYLLHHEFTVLLKTRYPGIYHDAGDCSPVRVAERRMAWGSLAAHANLLDLWSQTFLAKITGKLKELRGRFLRPLLKLQNEGKLLMALQAVAEEVYSHMKKGRIVVKIENLENGPKCSLEPEEHNACFLLVSEMIRNFCKHEVVEHTGEWSAKLNESDLVVGLRCGTSWREAPGSKTFEALNLFLREMEVGEAGVERIGDKELNWQIRVSLDAKRSK